MSAYDKVMAARDANKLTTVDYINHMFGDSFFELHGDRRYSDDKAVVAGLAMLHDMPVTGQKYKRAYGAQLRSGSP